VSLESLAGDVAVASRALLRRPGFTLAAFLSMALGIGANSVIFRVFNAAFLRPISAEDPESLVALYVTNEASSRSYLPISYPNYQDLASQNRVFSGLAAFQWLRVNLLQGERPRKIYLQVVTHGFFDMMGVPAALGRTLSRQDEDLPRGSPVAVLSHGFWQTELGGDPKILGRTVRLDRQTLTVVGVMPPGFKGTKAFSSVDLWAPMSVYRQVSPYARHLEERGAQMFEMVGRLRPDVSIRQAEVEVKVLAARLERDHPEVNRGEGLLLVPLTQATIEPGQRPVFLRAGLLLLAVVGLLLLIACGNVASLLLSRGLEQRKEIAVRLSLGARRGQLVRQMVVQSLLLSLAGGAMGLLLGLQAPAFLWRFLPSRIFTADALDFAVDGRVALFTFALSIAAALLFGVVPAVRATRQPVAATLKGEAPAAGLSKGRLSLRDLLIIAQTALCFLSLTGACLFLKSLYRTQQIDPGFDVERLAVMTYGVPDEMTDTARGPAYHEALLASLSGLPELAGAALASFQPLSGGPPISWKVRLQGGDSPGDRDGTLIFTNTVTPAYFSTLGIPLLRGRGFTAGDLEGSPPVAIINETMARGLWPGLEAVGQRFHAEGRQLTVVGVVADSKYISLGGAPQPCMYLPLAQGYRPEVVLHLRARGEPAAVLDPVLRRLRSFDPDLSVYEVQTMEDSVRSSLWAQRLGAALLTLFGLLALVLAITGIYAVLSYSVRQRLREVGIRMALGALPVEVIHLLVGRAMGVVALGIALGLAAAIAGSRLVATLLYGIDPADPLTYTQIAGALAAVAFAASYIAARQAARVDPARSLHPGTSFE
jgi:predicted permease